ncbi:MAG: hypothetical protein M1820_001956 [Bogoriella megaspora]|nr:MAG: hypothetical protein M1820_001956 [Bogoriella megaspora]
MSKNILVLCATGKQGTGVVDQLAGHPEINILAVTRNALSPGAKKLQAKGKNIFIIEGDQDDVPRLFQQARDIGGGPVWGVFSVQVSMGKGVTNEGEIRQGKAVIDESVKRGVKHFVYSSVDRGGNEASWDTETYVPPFQTKYHIEHHLRENAGSMGWTILRPVGFMDNMTEGFQVRVYLATMRDMLGSMPTQWVACSDIGAFAKIALENPEQWNHRAISIAGDDLNTKQLSEAFKRKTGQPMDGTFGALGWLLKVAIKDVRLMTEYMKTDGFKADIAECRKIHPGLMDLETWIEKSGHFNTNKN